MKNKVVLITGAGSGMGEATALLFAEQGAKVVVSDMNEDAAKRVVENIRINGYEAISIKCDVSDETQVRAMVEKTVATFGRLDAAYNNAGIQIAPNDTADIESADFDQLISINLKGVWLCMKYELLQMQKQGNGSIVNNSSIAGLLGSPGRAAYSAAKHGIIGLSKTAGAEYGTRGIRVNAVCPGTISTPMVDRMIQKGELDEQTAINATPMHRFAKASEVASVVLWLSTDAASYVNGQYITIDGGQTII